MNYMQRLNSYISLEMVNFIKDADYFGYKTGNEKAQYCISDGRYCISEKSMGKSSTLLTVLEFVKSPTHAIKEIVSQQCTFNILV